LVTLGFNYNIDSIVLPIVGITGIWMAFVNTESKYFLWLKFFFSLGFLFIALGFIKSGMEEFVKQTDLSFFNHYPTIVFLLLGILLTTIVQSSSATIALILSALNTNAITLFVATAIVLGSEIGTTFKLFLASANGLSSKKRVALGNFLFNLITVCILFLFLHPVNHFISNVLQIKDSLIAVVFFQSFVNLVCIIIFSPFLKMFGKFLLARYSVKEDKSYFISKVSVTNSFLAIEALENETQYFIRLVIDYSLDSFELKGALKADYTLQRNFISKTVSEKYDYIKQLHGEMHGFILKLQKTTSDKTETERLNQIISAVRNSMYAAKNIRDAQYDIEQMRNSSNDIKYSFYTQSRIRLLNFYKLIFSLVNYESGINNFKELTSLYQSVTTGYSESLHSLYKETMTNRVSEIEISTLINFNREIYTSFKSILFGLKDYLLDPKEADYFDAQPGFIR
jgi:phosphate:Na+ symporter